ncbi:beta-glucosidase [Cnuibacter sp. UC19_7]|uniref:beta-glucosidase family protein n=1 Tax=Cnuibacter sp. UC19_7 TaxID=3350166 RepID=UPI00366BD10A
MTDSRIRDLLAAMTDAEKVALTAGADTWTTAAVSRLGIPSVRLGDGPHGVRRPREDAQMSMFDAHPATCFPTAVTLGSTWDAALVREVGEALGSEALDHGIAVLLGPGVNLKRSPAGGRNFEYFSEDPLVTSTLGAAWTAGVQSTGVGVSLKHFAANETERRRYGVDSIVDERALRELYLACFEPIVTGERPETVMAAYNLLNGEHCAENRELLTTILRDEWGYDGVVVSDWGAVWDRIVSIPAGLDLTMPGLGRSDDDLVLDALASGRLSRADLDAAVSRILALVLSHADASSGDPHAVPSGADAHHTLARRVAAAGTVLLQNDGILPLKPGSTVALIGAMADDPRYQGAGSSHVTPTRLDTLRSSLTEALGEAAVTYSPGYARLLGTSPPSRHRIEEAVSRAREADVAVVVAGLPETFETEGVDRRHLRLPHAHEVLIRAVARVNPATIVVLQNGSPVEMPWRGEVAAVVEAYLGGQAGGSALADVLTGAAEPGGRLAETFPERYDDHPVARLPNGPATIEYRESLYVGYRWFDSVDAAVAFPFGHGLSYTTFTWSDARVTPLPDRPAGSFAVEVTVTNTGSRLGSDVVQVYVHADPGAVFRPEQELRGFAKVELEPGASERVRIELGPRSFEFWDAAAHGWRMDTGRYEVRVARSSRDIMWRDDVEVEEPLFAAAVGAVDDLPVAEAGGDARAAGVARAEGVVRTEGVARAEAGTVSAARDAPEAYRAPSAERRFPAADFAALLGRPLPRNQSPRPGAYTLDTAVLDMQDTVIGRLLLGTLVSQATRVFGIPAQGREARAIARAVASQLTLRLLRAGSGGRISRRFALRALTVLNILSRPRRRRRSHRAH